LHKNFTPTNLQNRPFWIISLDVSKAFERLNRESPWGKRLAIIAYRHNYFSNNAGKLRDQWRTAAT